MFTSRKARLIAVTAALGLGALAVPATAFASPPTGGTSQGTPQSATGTIAVNPTFAIDLGFAAFTVSAGMNNTAVGNVYVQSNDPSSYYVTEASTAYVNIGNSSITIAPTAVDADTYYDASGAVAGANGDYYQQFPGVNSAVVFADATDSLTGTVTDNPVSAGTAAPGSGYDAYGVDNYSFDPSYGLASSGTYRATVTYTLWGN